MVKWKSETKWKNWIGGTIGALVAGAAIMLGGVVVGNTAISQLVGLAVAQSTSIWNNVKDASVGDNLTNGILMTNIGLFDGTNFDRVRGTGGSMNVTPTGSATPAEAFANPTTAITSWSLGGIFNGSTWDRWRGQVAPVQGPTLFNSRTTGGADAANTITITGVAATRVHIYSVRAFCSPSGNASLQITDGATLLVNDSLGVSPTPIKLEETWPVGLTMTTGASGIVTVTTCGAGNTSTVEIQADQF